MNKSFNTLFVQPSNTFKFAIEQLEASATLDEKIVKIDKLNNLVETALEDFTSLSKIHKILKYEQNNTALESTSLFVESICHRQGMVFKPRYFSMENNSNSRQIAIEGVGSFLKAIWDAIISAIKKMIDWVSSLFTSSSGGGGGSGGKSLSEHLENKISQTEEIVAAVQETINDETVTTHLADNQSNGHKGNGPDYLSQYGKIVKKLFSSADYKTSVNECFTDAESFTKNISLIGTSLKKLNIDSIIEDINKATTEVSPTDVIISDVLDTFNNFKNFKETNAGPTFSSIFHTVSIGENFSLTTISRAYSGKEPAEIDLVNFMNEFKKNMFDKIISDSKKLVGNLKDSGSAYTDSLKLTIKKIDSELKNISADVNDEQTALIKRSLSGVNMYLSGSVRLLTLCGKEVKELIDIVYSSAALYGKIAKHYS